ncbi:MAG: hypothetical protein QNJ97_17715 [Myxococcota bacterium]|nr:hypothetical protein [Myxococcota bacterium]
MFLVAGTVYEGLPPTYKDEKAPGQYEKTARGVPWRKQFDVGISGPPVVTLDGERLRELKRGKKNWEGERYGD